MHGFRCILHRCITDVPYGPANALPMYCPSPLDFAVAFLSPVPSIVTEICMRRLIAQLVTIFAPVIVDGCIALHTLHCIVLHCEWG